jgi:hypothetical protein
MKEGATKMMLPFQQYKAASNTSTGNQNEGFGATPARRCRAAQKGTA